jgi:hypothetical protein
MGVGGFVLNKIKGIERQTHCIAHRPKYTKIIKKKKKKKDSK